MRAILLMTLLLGCNGKDGDTGVAGTGGTTTTRGTTGPSGTPGGPTGTPGGTSGTTGTTGTGTDAIDCGVELTAPTDGVCGLTAGTGAGVLLRGAVLAPDAIYDGGSVLIDGDGLIACVGCDCSGESAFSDATIIDCPDGAISPGLINPHDHITYTEGAPIDHGDTRYDHRHDWRGSLSTPSNNTSWGTEWGELRMVIGGTTSMVGSGYANGMVRNLDQDSANEGLDAPEVNNQTFPLGDSDEDFEDDCRWNWSDSEAAVAQESAYVPHTAEGIDDYAVGEFACMVDGFEGQDLVESNVAHVHAIGLSAPDYYRMARDGAQIIWSPRSNISLYGDTAQVPMFHRLGGIIAIGTDWTYSGSINTNRELACADSLNHNNWGSYFTDRELWEMATVNGAIALGAEAEIGALTAGLVADVAVFDRSGAQPFQAIFDADATGAVLVLRGGEALYGEDDVVGPLRSDCDVIDVCGEARAVCTQGEFGASFDTISSELSSDYPAIHCGIPEDEPTCEPSRPGEYDGLTADDQDGDGLADSADNCPQMFNPIRPMDDGGQADADGDGEGDACDATPIGTDYDADGVPNDDDVCPVDADDQADADSDGKGDTCDPCAEISNPDLGCPAAVVTITEIQDGTLDEGVGVTITGAIVTGTDADGFTAQDPAAASPAFSGVYVYTDSSPGVSIGDEVTATGTTYEYYDLTEISASSWSVTGSGAITPTVVSLSDAASEDYEGVLITVTATVTDAAYDCSADGAECADTDLWELGGGSGVVVYDRMYADSDWASHVGSEGEEVTLTGVMGYRWVRRRLMPRTAADFQ